MIVYVYMSCLIHVTCMHSYEGRMEKDRTRKRIFTVPVDVRTLSNSWSLKWPHYDSAQVNYCTWLTVICICLHTYVRTDVCTYRRMYKQWSDGVCFCEYVFMCYATCAECVYPLVLLGQRVLRTTLWWTRTKETRHCCPTMRRKSEDWGSMSVCLYVCAYMWLYAYVRM